MYFKSSSFVFDNTTRAISSNALSTLIAINKKKKKKNLNHNQKINNNENNNNLLWHSFRKMKYPIDRNNFPHLF